MFPRTHCEAGLRVVELLLNGVGVWHCAWLRSHVVLEIETDFYFEDQHSVLEA